ncbi:ATP/GTP-binding protein [Streptomyces sp. NBC_01381]|uniref:ATP/GTP-binding protein n=1 Tax=Streptomyces sp. NBC_01381 TaxID=2903845 RepID=UPI0022592A98|nr:ATP/GTP-binding protein [Streptomyces sp. NBC_01381]MCX4666102.1 ATP/GTP-binding protein [Streptomyces sp. NBC_01381]
MTKALLLAIFGLGLVAQFVQPVGDALEGKAFLGGALLSLVGYVLYSEVQKLNAALRPAPKDVVRMLDLRTVFDEALRLPEVRIDAIGFTGETVVGQLSLALEDLPDGVRPDVKVRILVPDFTKPMEIPGMLDSEGKAVDDERNREELLGYVRRHEQRMKALTRRLDHDRKADLDSQFRVLHISPFLKFCLINGDQLFDGIYDEVVKKPAADRSDQLLDLMGYQASLTRWHTDAGSAAREKCAQRKELFETLWDVARPFTPPAS